MHAFFLFDSTKSDAVGSYLHLFRNNWIILLAGGYPANQVCSLCMRACVCVFEFVVCEAFTC